MRLFDNMAEKLRKGIQSFLKLTPPQAHNYYIQETMDFNGAAVRNRIWYHGDPDEIAQLYKTIPGNSNHSRFWAAVPTAGMEIRKIHTGLPSMTVDILTSIVIADMNKIKVDDKHQEEFDKIAEENNFCDLIGEAVSEALIVGDGAFKVSIDTDMSKYPIIEFIPGERVDFVYDRGRVREIVFRTEYEVKDTTYNLEETYGYGYIETHLYKGNQEVPLTMIRQTENIPQKVEFDQGFMMATPFRIYKSDRWKGRGKSIIGMKTEAYDSLDETWSQWMDALRKGRSKEYIPESMIPRNPNNGKLMTNPNAFDHSFIAVENAMSESGTSKIELIQPAIPHESYLQTYITALDLCMQGIISPSTLGIDTKKLDNAEAQREKEKATLYTRNKIVDALQNTIPILVNDVFKAYATLLERQIEDIKVEVPFGEYANPSFESQVETVAKAKHGGIMSVEASVEELYGDSKDAEWKSEEVKRIKYEQGITEVEEVSISDIDRNPIGFQ